MDAMQGTYHYQAIFKILENQDMSTNHWADTTKAQSFMSKERDAHEYGTESGSMVRADFQQAWQPALAAQRNGKKFSVQSHQAYVAYHAQFDGKTEAQKEAIIERDIQKIIREKNAREDKNVDDGEMHVAIIRVNAHVTKDWNPSDSE